MSNELITKENNERVKAFFVPQKSIYQNSPVLFILLPLKDVYQLKKGKILFGMGGSVFLRLPETVPVPLFQ